MTIIKIIYTRGVKVDITMSNKRDADVVLRQVQCGTPFIEAIDAGGDMHVINMNEVLHISENTR